MKLDFHVAETIRASLLVLAFALVLPASAQERVPEAASPKAVKPGASALITAPKGMRYFLRVPKSYHPKRGARLIVFMHGSNMNGLTYLKSFEAKGWAADDILVCPNGEKGDDPYGANNFSFGSAPLVADVTESVKAAFRISRTYIGGHSQGGFVTYSVIMHHPDLYEGAFPMAGDCWMQNEPNLWEDKPAVVEKQKRIAIAVIHGKADPVVSFSQGQHAHDVFLAMGYPRLRLFAPERLGHQFMLSPVDEALDWLDAVNGADPKMGLELAVGWFKDGEYGWCAQVASSVLAGKRVPSTLKKRANNVLKGVEKAAAPAAKRVASAMREKPAKEWLPEYWEFQRQFGASRAARPIVRKYDEMRAKQRALGTRLFREARAAFRAEDKPEGRELLEKILSEAPATYEAHYALKWLEDD